MRVAFASLLLASSALADTAGALRAPRTFAGIRSKEARARDLH